MVWFHVTVAQTQSALVQRHNSTEWITKCIGPNLNSAQNAIF